ncbi:MAG: sarcosine oxidase subunit beta family protein [Steroidobacteraceae bacterium]|nr:sarcosine oxidase subunit beta family protein [Steroidobacteraceae bacterium]
MSRYSAWRLLREGLAGQQGWTPAWEDRDPDPAYDVVVVGGGGHGLATAYYLARTHGITRVAVLEKGWIGGGNTGRNTTIIRSNYFHPQSAALYDLSVSLYETLALELNYNIMFSQRGMMEIAHNQPELESMARAANAMRINGVDIEVIGRDEVLRREPLLDPSPRSRWPVYGALLQRRAGTARHDAVAWGYARAAAALGVHIVQDCEVRGFAIAGGRVVAVETSRGTVRAERLGLAVAGNSSVLARRAGFDLPLQSYTLQAMVSEPVKPCLNTVVLSTSTGSYVSQSDKGELVMGGNLDRAPSYAQRGSFRISQSVVSPLVELFPAFATLKLLRQWGGTVDTSPDNSPIIGPSPVAGLYLNCGWGTGGFKAIPAGGTLFAHLLATGRHHPLSEPFDYGRFARGELVDEGHAGVAH